MATIATMTNEGDAQTESPAATPVAAHPQPPAEANSASTANNPLLVPVLTTVTGALIAGVFLFAILGFNSLRGDFNSLRSDFNSMRNDMNSMRSDVKTEIGALRGEISGLRDEMNARFEAVNAVLLDHTDRLARIETHLDLRPSAEPSATSQS